MLFFEDGQIFARGCSPLSYRPVRPDETTSRLFVVIEVDTIRVEAVLDTGGVFLILPPAVAEEVGLTPASAVGQESVKARGVTYRGDLHPVSLRFVATEGDSLYLDLPALVPPNWTLPPYMGVQGCLEYLRFAIDLGAGLFYFGHTHER